MGDIKTPVLLWKRRISLLLKQLCISHWTAIPAFSQLAGTLQLQRGLCPPLRCCPVVLPEGQSPFAVQHNCLYERLSPKLTQLQLNWERDSKTASSLIYNYPMGRKLKWQYLSFHSLLVTLRCGVTLGKGKVISREQNLVQPRFLLQSVASRPFSPSSPLHRYAIHFISPLWILLQTMK